MHSWNDICTKGNLRNSSVWEIDVSLAAASAYKQCKVISKVLRASISVSGKQQMDHADSVNH